MPRVLVACEESQAVTVELRKMGIEAWSCDIIPASGPNPEWHLQQDVVPLLEQEWDMVIAFPPCTHLASSGASKFAEKRLDGRQQEGIDFFMKFTVCDVEHVAIENPIGIMSKVYRKPDQIIQPLQFGDPSKKKTCLWLKNLPPLVATDIVDPGPDVLLSSGKKVSAWYYATPRNSAARSKTFPGIAKAMANQWGSFL